MAGLRSILRDALLSVAERAEDRGARTLVRRLPENERGQAANITMHIGGDAYGFRPKDVTWAIDMPVSPEESRLNELRNQVSDALVPTSRSGREMPRGSLREALIEKRKMLEEAQGAQSYADYKAGARRYAPAAFKAARRALMDDIASRSPFEPWTPNAGYVFYGASQKHDDIYARMLAQARHPDYIAQTDGHTVYLRRKFPFRHEVAAGGALGALGYGSDAE